MRKLVSIQEVREVQAIEGAEAIEVAKILGWSVVIKKGEFKVGDKVIYAEIDSVLPEKAEFEFLRARKFRIRTIKLRGQISQGICFPMTLLPTGEYEVDQDVTEIMGVQKYEPPIPPGLEGVKKGNFPSFITKTDETRVQVLQKALTQNSGAICVKTEKLDGTSTTFYLNDDVFGVCSRNMELIEDDANTYWKMAKKYDVENKLRKFNRNIALQGETIGAGIQGNKYKLEDNQFFLFNVYDIDKAGYVDHAELVRIATALELPLVPVIDDQFILHDDIDQLVEQSKGFSVLNKKTKREGDVIRLKSHETGDGYSFKAINPAFLLKFGDD